MSEQTVDNQNMHEIIDACPRLDVNKESLFQKVEDYRDQIYMLLNDALVKLRIKGEVTKSAPYEYNTRVLIRLWKTSDKDSSRQHRGEAQIDIIAKPSFRYPIVVEIKATSGGKKRTLKRITEFNETSAYDLISFISAPSQKLRKSNYKRHGIIFDKNKVKKRPGATLVAVFGFLPMIGAFGLAIHPGLGVVTILACSIPLIKLIFAPVRVEAIGRPPQNPRNLVRMDSWQSVIIDLGELAKQVRTDVFQELVDGKHPDALIEYEEVSYLANTGKANRTQIVVNFRRAIAFIEVHSYGNDLYVDWEAYLNLGVWDEQSTGVGYDATNEVKVEYKDVQRSLEALNEYDISDANFLIEWVHACLTRVVRRLKKEKNIDQEFDFQIQRSDRRSVLREGDSKAKSGRKGFLRRS
ncbi:hypothetical protein [Glaciecola sp. 1036]|uniref:hypothetical protein n=1 Tax=Alteromonadaceae TaxID=72275 RepID=UPI003D07DA38